MPSLAAWRRTLLLCVGLILPGLPPTAPAAAACRLERGSESPAAPFMRHLSADCTAEDRAGQAVPAEEILRALAAGRAVDLDGVVVLGDLLLDRLPAAGPEEAAALPPGLREVIRAEGGSWRRIAQPVAITQSVVRGAVKSNLQQGVLAVSGAVTLTGTRFEGSLDLSRAAFGGPLDLSRASLRGDGFFIHAWLTQDARFEETAFGPHTRFHRAAFQGEAAFRAAVFHGLAEFLEVEFGRGAAFPGAAFRLGTGFSGSRFGGPADFSGARFEREAFFTFTAFEGAAVFREARFEGTADFSDAAFRGGDDFAGARFAATPRFDRARPEKDRPAGRGWQDLALLYVILLGLAGLGWWWFKRPLGKA